MNPTIPSPSSRLTFGWWLGVSSAEKCRRVALTCGLLALGLGLMALVGNSLHVFFGTKEWLYLAQLIPNSNEMVYATATLFVLLGGSLTVLASVTNFRPLRFTVMVVAVVGGLWPLAEVIETIAREFHAPLTDRLGFWQIVHESKMSMLTAGPFCLVSAALAALAGRPTALLRQAAAAVGAAVAGISLLVLLSYTKSGSKFNMDIIPMAFPTALAMLALGIGLIAAAGPDHFLLKPLSGRSARALLLRTFLPVILISQLFSVFVRGWLRGYIDLDQQLQVLSLNAVVVLGVIGLVGVVVLQVARVVGAELDRIEAERNRALDEMRQARDAAQDANRTKSQFLANMSHELRTPLNAILGYSEMLQEVVEERGEEDLLGDLRHIHDSGKHLLNLINDILDLSKIAAGRIELFPETIDVKAKILDVASTIRYQVEKNGNILEVSCTDDVGTMFTDLTRLKQCLLNLLSNAGKFTQNGKVVLRVRREASGGRDWMHFAVSDTGIGLTAEQLQRIFKPFVQADASTSRKYGGTGLGLTVSQSFCQLMGGTIRVSSEPGHGSTFTLEMPAECLKATGDLPGQPPPTPTTSKPATVPPLRTGPRILVADDDLAVQDMLSRTLTREGYEVVIVARGDDVVRQARALRPAAITLDVMMPGMDGWSVLAALKADPELADIPVIMLTIIEDKNLGYTLGAVDYLVKPVDHRRVLNVLKSHCGQQQAGRLALVAEDDAATREMLRRTLEGDGFVVVEAGNGREALEQMKAGPPALIVLDLMMPEMDGFEFLEELRRHEQWKSIPVVVVTAQDLTPEDHMFLTGGMFLVKRVLQKGTYSRDDLLKEAHALVAARGGRPGG